MKNFYRNKKCINVFTVSVTPHTFMLDHFEKLYQEGFDNIVIAGEDSFSDKLRRMTKTKHFVLRTLSFNRKFRFVNDFTSLLRILFIFYDESPHIIIAHTPKAGFYTALLRLIYRKGLFIFFCHGMVSSKRAYGIKNKLIEILEYYTFALSDKTFFVSKSLKKYALRKKMIKKTKAISLSGSISGIEISSNYKPRRIDKEHVRIGFLGRVCKSKGFFDCTKVCYGLAHKNINYEFHVAGEIEDQSLIGLFFDEKIKYHGFIDEKSLFFSKIDILLILSEREGFGMSALDASSYGVPIIGYKIIGLEDAVLNNVTGFLVKKGAVHSVIEIIKKYMHCPEIYEKHSINAYNFALTFDKNKIIDEQIGMIKRLSSIH
ncbi:MAG: glycosyltransferase [Desulfamplus sp.]|nr:glycosyltransferase [Desulfamplus sp.]